MSGLAVWVSNDFCCSEGQAKCEVWLCPSTTQFFITQCFPDISTNSGVLKILHTLQSTARERSLLLSQLPYVSHITVPQSQGMNNVAAAWHTIPIYLFCPFPPPFFRLQAFPVTVQNVSHFGNTCAVNSDGLGSLHVKSPSSPAKHHRLSCSLSTGPLAFPEARSAECRGDEVKPGTVVQVLPFSLFTEINQKQKHSLWLFHWVTSVSKTCARHAKYVFLRIYCCLRFVCFFKLSCLSSH